MKEEVKLKEADQNSDVSKTRKEKQLSVDLNPDG